eukprot:TRINITY_DN911_c0_g1_i1.p1 TRINITY_DN911_c0_g1~~TRINITY_DN911_c0_g1_i1.p1  ORF type:complete len:175 (+),score=18.57 TRINITY_DN911_c0_g1_i1:102-626(+)
MNSVCPHCNQRVYFAERQTGPDGKIWHRGCVIKNLQSNKKPPSTFESYPDQIRRAREREARLASRRRAQETKSSPDPSSIPSDELSSEISIGTPVATGEESGRIRRAASRTTELPTRENPRERPRGPSQSSGTASAPNPVPSLPPSVKFCIDCGCPRYPNDAKFCWQCGFSLSV